MAGTFWGDYCTAGCCCTPATSTSCTTVVAGLLADISGVTGPKAVFCPAPPTLSWTLDGTGSVTYHAQGSFTPSSNGSTGYGFSLSFNALPAGSYNLRIFSAADACGTRFDKTFSVGSTCPQSSTTSGLVLPSQYDLINDSSQWFAAGCKVPSGIAITVTPSASNASICTSQSSSGFCTVTLKVTAYPFSVSYSATAPDCLGQSQTNTYASCSSVSSDWCGNSPQVMYTKWPCAAWCCQNCTGAAYYPLPGATITVSGGVTGSGSTTSAGATGGDIVTITAWVAPKCGVTASQLEVFWTVQHPKCVTASYNDSDPNTTNPNNVAYGGSAGYAGGLKCPIGGYVAADANHACGNCPEPLATTLHATVLGVGLTLFNNGSGSGWVGGGTWTTKSNVCRPGNRCPGVSVGPVPFQVVWGGFACSGSSSPSVRFSSNQGFGVLCQCPVGGAGQYWATGCGAFSTAANGETASCSPLLSSGSCSLTSGVYDVDNTGTCVVTNFAIAMSWNITE